MNKKEASTKKPISTIESAVTQKSTKSLNDKQRGTGVFELIFTAASLATAILFAAMSEPKIPRQAGD